MNSSFPGLGLGEESSFHSHQDLYLHASSSISNELPQEEVLRPYGVSWPPGKQNNIWDQIYFMRELRKSKDQDGHSNGFFVKMTFVGSELGRRNENEPPQQTLSLRQSQQILEELDQQIILEHEIEPIRYDSMVDRIIMQQKSLIFQVCIIFPALYLAIFVFEVKRIKDQRITEQQTLHLRRKIHYDDLYDP